MRWGRGHLRSLTEVARVRPDYLTGLRAAAATVLPLLFGELHGSHAFVWMALGGWLTTLSDPGGSFENRAIAMSGFAAAGTAAVLVGGTAGPFAVPALFLVALACGLARIRGDSAATNGTLVLIAFCISLGFHPGSSLLLTGMFGAGAVYAMALSLVFWAVHPYKAAREAVGDCYAALADAARILHAVAGSQGSEEEWLRVVRARASARAALEQARRTLGRARRGRESRSHRGELLVLLAELADLSLGTISALTEAMHLRPAHLDELRRVADAFAAIAQAVPAGAVPPELPPPAVEGSGEGAVLLRELHEQARLATEQAGLLAKRVSGAEPRGVWHAPDPPGPTLRDVLRPGSLVLQHALRVAIACSVALLLAEALHLQRAHWVLVTTAIILQPSAGATMRRALARVAGTLLGATVAALLTPVLRGPLSLAAVLFPLSVLAMAVRPLNYSLYAALVTPVFVLMAESTGGDFSLVRVRIVNTLIGGAVALLAAYFLFRVRERNQLPGHLAALFAALRDYLSKTVAAAPPHDLVQARRAVGLAAANAEASLQRLLAEEHRDQDAEAAMAALAWARRVSGSISALRATPEDPERAAAVEAALDELAAAAREERAPRPAPPLHESPQWARLDRQLAVLRAALGRLAEPS